MSLSYQRAGLNIGRGLGSGTSRQIRDLQRDLRRLGYLLRGIDGSFGAGSERAVKALQHDLLHNVGAPAADGTPPVKVVNYNQGRVMDVTGVCDQGLAGCMADMLDDPAFPTLPDSSDPAADNDRARSSLAAMPAGVAPMPFLLAMFRQESSGQHFRVPTGSDEDRFITVGLDTNASEKHVITSRGYGIGQYTLFHHPPTPAEVSGVMLDVAGNVEKAASELRNKFNRFVNGRDFSTVADDRRKEVGSGPLRVCKFGPGDPRFMKDCRQCLLEAGAADIVSGVTPVFVGSSTVYAPTQYYKKASYGDVPIRADIPCDWPYAVRRYNGSGINSYHYQTRVLKFLVGTER